ncbi:hypothetical protein BDV39DRAFT_218454 [Aspergillus sergii]|uniref:Uncharacterized protein n=1 Tax=Aspergillus sergii TaxID=1034303 RepID=A0A5N6WT38_9EURO|nr:hypothetical protein BDV39DRAFT_218454 [Aspergillus sergii]
MAQHAASSPYVRHRPRELRRLYEPLSLLCALQEQMAEQKDIEVVDAGGVGGILHPRRDFLNALVQLAAFEQGCDLAITAGYDHDSVVIAVAGSPDVSDRVIRFLERLLGMVTGALHAGSCAETWNRELSKISNYVTGLHNENSFAVYHMIFHQIAPICINSMAASSSDAKGMAMASLWFGISHRMFSESQRSKQLSQVLERIVPAPSKLIELLKSYQENVFTQVHPELRLVDFFDKSNRVQYFDKYDRYIATSKPSCYLCSQYLSHRLNYHLRKCDPNDIDLHWRLPDIKAAESSAHFKEQRDILRKITERVRRDVESFVLDRCSESNESLMDDDISQSFSLSSETTTKSEELSYGEADECPNPYRFPLGTEGDKPSGCDQYAGGEDEDEEDEVVFRGRLGTFFII